MSIVYYKHPTTIACLIFLVGFALTAQTAFATNATNGNQQSKGNATGNNMTDPAKVNATANEFSYKYGYKGAVNSPHANPYSVGEPMDACRGPDVNTKGQFIPITNKTACMNGWAHAWKDWCTAHTKECVNDLLVGKVPNFIVAAHHQYLAGYNYSTPGGWPGMCPAGHRNAAFCAGYQHFAQVTYLGKVWSFFAVMGVRCLLSSSSSLFEGDAVLFYKR